MRPPNRHKTASSAADDTDIELARRLAVIIPTLNEALSIQSCISSLTENIDHFVEISVTIVDGGSSDGTQKIVDGLATLNPNITLLHNPDRVQSAGVNKAVDLLPKAKDLIIRCDSHATYPPGFLYRVCRSMLAQKATSLVVPMDARGESCFQKANAWIVDTPFGSGGAPHRGGRHSGFVDHGHHAGFDRAFFEKIGGYDTTFTHNEDAEFDIRAREAGGKIYLDSDIRVTYLPRGTFPALWRQYYFYGKGRAKTIIKNRTHLAIRQILPLLNYLLIVVSFLAAPFFKISLLWPGTYLLALGIISASTALYFRSLCGLLSGPILASIHLCWAHGFLRQILSLKRPPARSPKDHLT